MVRQHQTRNLQIPGSMLAHRPGMTIQTLDFPRFRLYFTPVPQWRRLKHSIQVS
jgi:hypothetical protein